MNPIRIQKGVTAIGAAYSIQVTPLIGGRWGFTVTWSGGSHSGNGRTQDEAWQAARAILNARGVVV
jgi:hypothetical protein